MITSTVGHVMDWSFLSVFFNHQRPRTFRTRREGNHVEVLKWQLNESSDGCGSKMMGIPPKKNNRILEKSWKNGEIKRSNMKLYDFCWGDVWFFASHGPWPDVCLKSGIIHSVAAVVWCHHSWNFWTSAWGDFDPVSLWMTCFDNLTSKMIHISGPEKKEVHFAICQISGLNSRNKNPSPSWTSPRWGHLCGNQKREPTNRQYSQRGERLFSLGCLRNGGRRIESSVYGWLMLVELYRSRFQSHAASTDPADTPLAKRNTYSKIPYFCDLP